MFIKFLKSKTDVITNSSTEVFCIYNDDGISTIKDIINAIFELGGSNLTADDVFDFKYRIETDMIEDDCLEWLRNNVSVDTSDYENLSYNEQENYLLEHIPYDEILSIARSHDEYTEYTPSITGVDVIVKGEYKNDPKVINAAKKIQKMSSIWDMGYCYG